MEGQNECRLKRFVMFQNLYPDEEYPSAYLIDYEAYYRKGYRGILFDVDNTLVEHDYPVTLEAIALFGKLQSIGFETCIISNNKEVDRKSVV